MNKYIVMAVRDRAADVFGQPMFVLSRGGAIRGFGDEINRKDADNQLAKHPEDFDLYELGTFNDVDGSFECGVPKMICVGKDQVR